MRVLLYGNGVCVDMGKPVEDSDKKSKKKPKKKLKKKRGKITGAVSSASFRRMREFCITHDCDERCWGVTLTVPGSDLLSCDKFREMVHLLSVYCNRWHITVIWRCELQRRGQPHLHLVLYGDQVAVVRILVHWQKIVRDTGYVYNVEPVGGHKEVVSINRAFCNGSQHMFDVQALTGDYRSWRYLVAHASKGKRDQLGFVGRQWGVICRDKLQEVEPSCIDLDPREMFCIRRWVRRASRRCIGKYGRHFVLMNPFTMQRMVNYVREDYFGAPF